MRASLSYADDTEKLIKLLKTHPAVETVKQEEEVLSI
jgi:hypothetical protein